MRELTIRRLKRSGFDKLYKKLILGQDLSDREKTKVLSLAVILINQTDKNLNNLGYRIALAYGNHTGDFEPLYDLSLNSGLMPVAASIQLKNDEGFFTSLSNSHIQAYGDGGIINTEDQYRLKKYFSEKVDNDVSVVAPTSYGKSDLILGLMNELKGENICVIVPSKSLVAQTKKRIIDANIDWAKRIITHPEMFKSDEGGLICVLTQERLSRLLYLYPDLDFDTVFIDEAHNIFGKDDRNELLASVLSIIKVRNNDAKFKYLTPFLVDSENLNLRYVDQAILNYKVSEYIKSERLYLSDFRKGKKSHSLYDQFLSLFFDYDSQIADSTTLIREKALEKNIIYFNRPKNIESFCVEFIADLDDVECEIVQAACKNISDMVSPNYRLVECLRKGVAYHHGSIPDNVKLYVEEIFRTSKKLKYLVTSSTLLEGVNLPAERMFVMEIKKGRSNLAPSQFKNLIGRVSRFSEVFSDRSEGKLKLLEPSIYVVGTDKFLKGADLQGFLVKTMKVDAKLLDKLENPLLINTDLDKIPNRGLEIANQRLENLHQGVIDEYEGKYAETDIGRLLFVNNITEIDVFSREHEIQTLLDDYVEKKEMINSTDELMRVISTCFLTFVEDDGLNRLTNDATQRYYSMFLTWMMSSYSFSRMVAQVVSHWQENDKSLVYVGKWGEETYGNGFLPYWTNLQNKDEGERLNLAIVRVKEEEDFVDYKIFRFIDVLNDFGLLEENFYLNLKYGTTDKVRIDLLKEGFSRSLSKLLAEKYSECIGYDDLGDVKVDSIVLSKMEQSSENEMTVFEASMNLAN